MAPVKFEENIKDKLEKRSLKPSVNAWNNLEKRLDTQDKKQKGKIFWWFGIAASIISVLLITQQFMSTNFNNEQQVPIIVDMKKIEPITPQKNSQIVEGDKVENVIPIKSAPTKKNKEDKLIQTEQFQTEQYSLKENAVVTSESNEDKINVKKAQRINPDETIVKNEMDNNLIAETHILQDVSHTTIDDELDILLDIAILNVTNNSSDIINTKTVDANSLLQEVEVDIEHSFRGTAIKIIETNYKTIKNAVATRND